jgi:Mg/Co/Ni transporter MgtE
MNMSAWKNLKLSEVNEMDMSEISTAVFLGLIIGTVTGTGTTLIIYWLASLISKD